jgi:two-component system KDP operon response regulator KdpE
MTDELKILLIEDEPQMRRFLRASIASTGFELIEAANGYEGLAAAREGKPDVILLDLGLPDIDGLEVTKRLRQWSKTPILILSARHQDRDKVAALDAGADDYLTKPFSLPELLARIRVARRHATPANVDALVTTGEVRIDLGRRVVLRGEEDVRLTPLEYKLLATLARHAGRVMTYESLLKEVWGVQYAQQRQYLHVYIGHLRSKLERDPARPRFLMTESGVGYRLKAD